MNASLEGIEFRGQRVTVAGLGLFGGGAAVARWLANAGAHVTVTDLRGSEQLAPALDSLAGARVRLVLGEHRMSDFQDTGLVVANPAVPPGSPFLRAAREAGVPVTSEIALFLERTPARLAIVTGTQGKSSTCQFLSALCAGAGHGVHLGGNIGTPLIERLDAMQPADIVVLELSSYQLEALPPSPRACAQVVAITNIGADHLERHGSIEAYTAAKARVLELLAPDGRALLPTRLSELHAACPVHATTLPHQGGPGPGLSIEDGQFLFRGEALGRTADLALTGGFQRENVLLALGAAYALGIPVEHLTAGVSTLTAPPHRFEDLGLHAGRRVIDNGVSTTPESTCAALADVPSGSTLLVGGEPKRGLDYAELARRAAEADARTIVFGEAARELTALFAGHGASVLHASDVASATRAAFESSTPGSTILFSPACASFDAWPNFRARALAFRAGLPTSEHIHEAQR